MTNPKTLSTGLIGCLALTGCAAHNYDFDAVTTGPSRITRLVADRADLTDAQGESEEELYDFSMLPLVYSHLHVFSEEDDPSSPVKFVEADIDTYLPLFGFVNGTVSQYDQNQSLLTKHEFDSSLWGAFRNHSERIVSHAGTREQTHHTFLWIFSWTGKETWHPTPNTTIGTGYLRAQ
jgi:hypothetical protein